MIDLKARLPSVFVQVAINTDNFFPIEPVENQIVLFVFERLGCVLQKHEFIVLANLVGTCADELLSKCKNLIIDELVAPHFIEDNCTTSCRLVLYIFGKIFNEFDSRI